MWAHAGYALLYVIALAAIQVQWRYCVPVCTQVLKAAQALFFVALVRLYAERDSFELYKFNAETHFNTLQRILNKTLS